VKARVQARSATYCANELCRVLMETVQVRGLSPDYLHTRMGLLLDGFRSWIVQRHLLGVILEVWDPATGAVVERYELPLDYVNDFSTKPERYDTNISLLKQALGQRASLHPGCQYRVVADLGPGAPSLPGWTPTELRDVSHLTRTDLGDIINTPYIGISMSAWF
jgi:hypothetical protein